MLHRAFPYYSLFTIHYSLFTKKSDEKRKIYMYNESPLLEKSLKFAARIVKLYQYLVNEKKESIISKQIIRSGTSIGANANEAAYGVSQADFTSKLQISLKETAETEYWLRLLVMSGYIDEAQGNSMISDCLEINRILIASLKTAKDKKQ